MIQFTAQQKREYYQEAANKIAENQDSNNTTHGANAACLLLAEAAFGCRHDFPNVNEETFPELYLFKESIHLYWLADTDRLLVLAFCMEITEEKK